MSEDNQSEHDKQTAKRNVEQKRKVKIWNYFETNSRAIQAISALTTVFLTFGLVFYSILGWSTADRVQELQMRQFIAANAPVVNVLAYNKKHFPEFDDGGFRVGWQLDNQGGGYVTDIKTTMFLFQVVPDNVEQYKIKNLLKELSYKPKVVRSYTQTFYTSEPQYIAWLESAYKAHNSLYLAVAINYVIPNELTLSKRAEQESMVYIFKWGSKLGSFSDVEIEEEYKTILSKLKLAEFEYRSG